MSIQTSPFEYSFGVRFRGKGISGTAAPFTTSNVDYKVTEARYINGCHLILKNHVWDDSLKFQIVDVDNVLGYGAGAVLDEFGTTWKFADDKQDQGLFKIEYPAKILANLYIRIAYTSVGAVPVNIHCNLFLHTVP